MTRDEARAWYAQMLLDKVRQDRYPSATQLAMLEDVLTVEMIPDYLEVLMDKVAEDNWPSVPMLQRIQRVVEALPQQRRELPQGD